MSFENFQDAIVSPSLKAIASHWGSVRAGRPMPSWEKLQPSRIAAHLSIVWVYKYDRDTKQFTGRLAGDRITRGFGKSFRGIALRDVHPPTTYPWIYDEMTRIIRECVLYRCEGELFKHAGHIAHGERIALPLAGDGVHCDGVFGASEYNFPHPPASEPVELMGAGASWFAVQDAGPHKGKKI